MLLASIGLLFASSNAYAVDVTNWDKSDAKFVVEVEGKEETVTLKSGEQYSTKNKDATFTIGNEPAKTFKGASRLLIYHGKIDIEPNPKPAPSNY